jgi:hypothetical protein
VPRSCTVTRNLEVMKRKPIISPDNLEIPGSTLVRRPE